MTYVWPKQQGLYQLAFEECINSIDLVNMTNRSYLRDYDQSITFRDFNKIEEIAMRFESERGLIPLVIQVMVEQCVYADPMERERWFRSWTERVLHRDSTDFFPDSGRVADALINNEPI